MKRKYVIYAIFVIAAVSSVLLAAAIYIYKCPFIIGEASAPQGERTLYKDYKMLVETDMNGLNKRVSGFMDEHTGPLIERGMEIEGVALALKPSDGSGKGELYINVTEGFPFSFKCGLELIIENGVAEAEISDIRLGIYELPYIGDFLWRKLQMPENITIPLKKQGELRYLSGIDVTPGGVVTLCYDYDGAALSDVFIDVLKHADKRKIEYHRENGSVDESLIRIVEKGNVSAEEALELVSGFKKEPETFLSLCYLLDDDGIRQLYSNFGGEYYKYVGPEELAEASENEIDSGLNEFHKRFSRLVLNYLYLNPDYTIKEGALYLDGKQITPHTVLAGTGNTIYDIELWADGGNITATYRHQGYEAEKVIIKDYGK